MYAKSSNQLNPFTVDGREELKKIKISLIADREGQQLRNFLLDKLNPYGEPKAPRYRLDTTLSLLRSGIALRKDGTFQRYKITGTARYTLVDLETGKIIHKDQNIQVSSFIVPDSNAESAYSATISERSEKKNVTKRLAEDITLSILSILLRDDHLKLDQTGDSEKLPPANQTTRIRLEEEHKSC